MNFSTIFYAHPTFAVVDWIPNFKDESGGQIRSLFYDRIVGHRICSAGLTGLPLCLPFHLHIIPLIAFPVVPSIGKYRHCIFMFRCEK